MSKAIYVCLHIVDTGLHVFHLATLAFNLVFAADVYINLPAKGVRVRQVQQHGIQNNSTYLSADRSDSPSDANTLWTLKPCQ